MTPEAQKAIAEWQHSMEAKEQLSAAAPDLLAVCETVAAWPHKPGECSIVDQARAAIAKAKGG